MNQQFVTDEVWEPISDWGRSFQSYMENKNIVPKPVKPPKPVKQRAPRAPKTIRPAIVRIKPTVVPCHCTKCGVEISRRHINGLCKSHNQVARQMRYIARKKAS